MIEIESKVVCDVCGTSVSESKKVEYRVFGGINSFVVSLERQGWTIKRDNKYRLQYVLCPGCKDKPVVSAKRN